MKKVHSLVSSNCILCINIRKVETTLNYKNNHRIQVQKEWENFLIVTARCTSQSENISYDLVDYYRNIEKLYACILIKYTIIHLFYLVL